MKKSIINTAFILLIIATVIFCFLWYSVNSAEWAKSDPPIEYIIGFFYICPFGFIALIGELVLWRSVLFFATPVRRMAVEKVIRIILIITSVFSISSGFLYWHFSDYEKLIGYTALCTLLFQLVCECAIPIIKRITIRKRHTA